VAQDRSGSILQTLGTKPEPDLPPLYQFRQKVLSLFVTPDTPADKVEELERAYRHLSKIGTDRGLRARREEKAMRFGVAMPPSGQSADRTSLGLAAIIAAVNEGVRLSGLRSVVVEQRPDRRQIVEEVFGSPLDQRPDTEPPIGWQIMEVLAVLLIVDDLADDRPSDGWARWVLDRIRDLAPGSWPPGAHGIGQPPSVDGARQSRSAQLGWPLIFQARCQPAARLAESLVRFSDDTLSRLGRCAADACWGTDHPCRSGLYPYFIDTTQARNRRTCCQTHRVNLSRSKKRKKGAL